MYISHLIQIFDEVKRVLKPEGTCWVVIGDTYVSNPGDRAKVGGFQGKANKDRIKAESSMSLNKHKTGLPPKSLCQIPSRFAIAMTDAGWVLRNEIIWHKRNCMPSSASDRFTVDFEKIYFFSKQQKYWFEQQLEPHTAPLGQPRAFAKKGNNDRNDTGRVYDPAVDTNSLGRNKRCVWDIPTKPFSEAHFAVFPEDLVLTPLLAGCPEGGIVLDPFSGAGTVAVVAKKNNRNYIGFELNPEYIVMAEKRLAETLYQHKLGI